MNNNIPIASTSKSEFRKKLRDEIARTSPSWLQNANSFLLDNLKNLFDEMNLDSNCAVLGWIPYFYGEADLVNFSEKHLPQFFCPRTTTENGLSFYKMPCALGRGPSGIPEPSVEAEALAFSKFKQIICLVPGLGFDRCGWRLGRGKGMYDRFLEQAAHESALTKVGVCWSFQLLDFLPSEAHDQRMDAICTEQGIINTRLLS